MRTWQYQLMRRRTAHKHKNGNSRGICVRYDEKTAAFIKEYDKKEIRIYEKTLFSQEELDDFNAEIIGNVWDNSWNGTGVAK